MAQALQVGLKRLPIGMLLSGELHANFEPLEMKLISRLMFRVNCTMFAQEALCNARKHSRATLVSIFLNWGADTISLTISDNGQGFLARRPKAAMEGFGLSSMRERALRIGGTIDICSTPRRGTEVRLKMPSRRD